MVVEPQAMQCNVADVGLAKFRVYGSDSVAKAALKAALENTGYQSLAKIRIDIDQDKVRLRGKVSNYFMKQTAQEAIRKVAVGLKIDNQIRVREA